MVSTNAAILTPQEQAVLCCIMRGMDNPEIAAELGIARSTANQHIASIRRKLGGDGKSSRWWITLANSYGRRQPGDVETAPTAPTVPTVPKAKASTRAKLLLLKFDADTRRYCGRYISVDEPTVLRYCAELSKTISETMQPPDLLAAMSQATVDVRMEKDWRIPHPAVALRCGHCKKSGPSIRWTDTRMVPCTDPPNRRPRTPYDAMPCGPHRALICPDCTRPFDTVHWRPYTPRSPRAESCKA